MKTLILILFPFICSAQFGSIKVAFMGNSYCNGGGAPVVGDERPTAYRYLVRQRLGLYYSTVTQVKLCLGGEDVTDGMPDWYPGTITARNVDSALRSNPDLIIIEYAGNHFADKVPYDTILSCYQYLADTLQGLGKRFIFTSSMPRKTAIDAPLTYVEYQDTAQQFNTWLYSNYPGSSVDVFTHLYDPAINKPVFDYLTSDSLHWDSVGYSIIADDLFQATIIDTLTAFEKPRIYNLTMTQDGDSVEIAGHTIRAKDVKVYTSSDGSTFTERYDSGLNYNTTATIRVKLYEYVKLVATNNSKVVTITRQFIPD